MKISKSRNTLCTIYKRVFRIIKCYNTGHIAPRRYNKVVISWSKTGIAVDQLVELIFNLTLSRRIVKIVDEIPVESKVEMRFRNIPTWNAMWCCDKEDINGRPCRIKGVVHESMET